MDYLLPAAVGLVAGALGGLVAIRFFGDTRKEITIPPTPANRTKIVTTRGGMLTHGKPETKLTLPLEPGSWAVLVDLGCVLYTTDTGAVNDPGGIHCRLEIVRANGEVLDGVDGYYQHVQHVNPEAGSIDPENIPSRGSVGMQLQANCGFESAEARVICEIRTAEGVKGGLWEGSGMTAIPLASGIIGPVESPATPPR